MAKVELEVYEYDNLKRTIEKNKKRIEALEAELKTQKAKHEAEITSLVNDGRVRKCTIIQYIPAELSNYSSTTVHEVVNFDDVKEEVYNHFKEGIFDEELDERRNRLDNLINKYFVDETKKSVLEEEIERLRSRSLWQRIINK